MLKGARDSGHEYGLDNYLIHSDLEAIAEVIYRNERLLIFKLMSTCIIFRDQGFSAVLRVVSEKPENEQQWMSK